MPTNERGCGKIFSQRLRKLVKVFPKDNESCAEARSRVSRQHLSGKSKSKKSFGEVSEAIRDVNLPDAN